MSVPPALTPILGVVSLEIAKCNDDWVEWRPMADRARITALVGGNVIVLFGAIALCLSAEVISFRKVASIDPALVFRT